MKTVFTFTKPILVANTRTTSVSITVARDAFIGFNIAKVAVFTIFAFGAGVSCATWIRYSKTVFRNFKVWLTRFTVTYKAVFLRYTAFSVIVQFRWA